MRKTDPSWGFPKSERLSIGSSGKTPAPGSYSIPEKSVEGPKF